MRGLNRRGVAGAVAVVLAPVMAAAGGAVAVAGTTVSKAPLPANAGSNPAVNLFSVSCTSAGNCTAVGYYFDGVGSPSGRQQVFVVRETNGTWGQAITIPGAGLFDAGSGAGVTSVSCATAGNCAAGLTYTSDTGPQQAFVASEANGTWGTAIEIPGLSALNTGGNASIGSVSCGSAGNCAAGGTYTGGAGHTQAFVVNQS